MKKLALFFLALALVVPAAIIQARPYLRVRAEQAEASLDRDIELRATAEKTISWVDANRAEMRRAAGIEVLEDMGRGKFKVRKTSPKGTFVWIVQESAEKVGDKYVFKSSLVESIEGGMVYSNTEITITPLATGVKINVKVSAAVSNPRVKSAHMRLDMNHHFNQVKRLLEENVK